MALTTTHHEYSVDQQLSKAKYNALTQHNAQTHDNTLTQAYGISFVPAGHVSWSVHISGEHLFEIYRKLIGRPHIALARQDKIYRNISDALGRLRSDHKYFSISQRKHITVHCRKKEKTVGYSRKST